MPYTDHAIENLANQGVKKILVFSPAFVADCLETTIEIGKNTLIFLKKMVVKNYTLYHHLMIMMIG